MVTDMLDAVRRRFGSDERVYLGHRPRTCTPCMYAHVHPSCAWHVHGMHARRYLGHIETCSKIQHNAGDKFYDPVCIHAVHMPYT